MSRLQVVTAPDVPDPVAGLFSNAVEVDGILYVAGMHAGGAGEVPADMLTQARVAFGRVLSLVQAAGGTAADVTKVTIYVSDMSAKDAVGQARREAFPEPPLPAATLVEVSGFVAPELLIEVEAVAHLPR